MDEAIEDAEAAIEVARAAVDAQAGETYEVEITDETRLRAEVGKARKELHDDLKAVFDLVKAAREAVREAATTLAQIPRPDDTQSPATSTISE